MNSGGDTDGTREVPEPIAREEVKNRIGVLFNLMGCHMVDD